MRSLCEHTHLIAPAGALGMTPVVRLLLLTALVAGLRLASDALRVRPRHMQWPGGVDWAGDTDWRDFARCLLAHANAWLWLDRISAYSACRIVALFVVLVALRHQCAEVMDLFGFDGAAAFFSEAYSDAAREEIDYADLPELVAEGEGDEGKELGEARPAMPPSPPPTPPASPPPPPPHSLVFHPQFGLIPKEVRWGAVGWLTSCADGGRLSCALLDVYGFCARSDAWTS